MVTKESLSQYIILKREIKYLSERIDKLRNEQSKHEENKEHDMVRASHKYFPYTEHGVQIEGLTSNTEKMLNATIKCEIRTLERRYDELLQAINEIIEFIDEIPDSYVRMIVTYRFVEGMSWRKIADIIGGGNTEDSIRKTFNRFIEKSCN